MQRDSTKNSVQEARENFNAANEAFLAKQQEVEPLQQGRKTQGEAQRAFQQEYRDLEVRSEAELDNQVIAQAMGTTPLCDFVLPAGVVICKTHARPHDESNIPQKKPIAIIYVIAESYNTLIQD